MVKVTITEKGAGKRIRGKYYEAGDTVELNRRDARTICAVKFARAIEQTAATPAKKKQKKKAKPAKKIKNRAMESE